MPYEDYFQNNGRVAKANQTTCHNDDYNVSWFEDDLKNIKQGALAYEHPHHRLIVGAVLNVSELSARLIILPLIQKAIQSLNESVINNFTILTGSSSNHFQESNYTVKRMRQLFPDKRLIFYDLGLEKKFVSQVTIANIN